MRTVGRLICQRPADFEDKIDSLRAQVKELTGKYPLYQGSKAGHTASIRKQYRGGKGRRGTAFSLSVLRQHLAAVLRRQIPGPGDGPKLRLLLQVQFGPHAALMASPNHGTSPHNPS